MVIFNDSNHSYYSDKGKYTSVTTLVHKFVPPFDKEYWSLYKAIEAELPSFMWQDLRKIYSAREVAYHLEELNPTMQGRVLARQKEIKKAWKLKNLNSQIKGTEFHKVQEDLSYSRGYELNKVDGRKYKTFVKPDIGHDNYSLNLETLEDGYYPELLLWNNQYMLAGQADKVYITTIRKYRYFDIGDYKTNEEIKTSNKYQSMLSPLDHLDNCNYNHYQLQLSLYAWMLEQYGFKCRNLSFDHYPEGKLVKTYEFTMLRKEVDRLLYTP
jgi:ATP-dependent exoDNAse (exonuclease V) beta subunit